VYLFVSLYNLWDLFFKIYLITVNTHIKTVSFIKYVDKITIYYRSKFHLLITNPSLDSSTKTKSKFCIIFQVIIPNLFKSIKKVAVVFALLLLFAEWN
jgi:hypothetical protein